MGEREGRGMEGGREGGKEGGKEGGRKGRRKVWSLACSPQIVRDLVCGLARAGAGLSPRPSVEIPRQPEAGISGGAGLSRPSVELSRRPGAGTFVGACLSPRSSVEFSRRPGACISPGAGLSPRPSNELPRRQAAGATSLLSLDHSTGPSPLSAQLELAVDSENSCDIGSYDCGAPTQAFMSLLISAFNHNFFVLSSMIPFSFLKSIS